MIGSASTIVCRPDEVILFFFFAFPNYRNDISTLSSLTKNTTVQVDDCFALAKAVPTKTAVSP